MADVYRIDLRTPRSVREIVSSALSLYRRYPLLFAVLALAVIAPYDLAFLGITGYGPFTRLAHRGQGVFWLNGFIRVFLVTALISALHIHAVIAVGDGRRPRPRTVAWAGIRVLPVVGTADVLTNIGILLGFIILIVPGVLLLLRWAVVAQAAALEREGPLAAIRSSRQLTAGFYWHILWLLLIVAVLDVAVNQGARELPLGSSTGAASVSVAIALQTIFASFSALTLALLYFDLQARPQLPQSKRQ